MWASQHSLGIGAHPSDFALLVGVSGCTHWLKHSRGNCPQRLFTIVHKKMGKRRGGVVLNATERRGYVAEHGASTCAYRRRSVCTHWWPLPRHPPRRFLDGRKVPRGVPVVVYWPLTSKCLMCCLRASSHCCNTASHQAIAQGPRGARGGGCCLGPWPAPADPPTHPLTSEKFSSGKERTSSKGRKFEDTEYNRQKQQTNIGTKQASTVTNCAKGAEEKIGPNILNRGGGGNEHRPAKKQAQASLMQLWKK